MNIIIKAIAHYHVSITSQFEWNHNYELQSLDYIDAVRLYAMLGVIPGEKEILRTLDFNYKIYKEKLC